MFAYFELYVNNIFDNDSGQEFDNLDAVLLFMARDSAEYILIENTGKFLRYVGPNGKVIRVSVSVLS